ncbi:hypothetical protein QJS04_geneDACA013328 [Acorus gramineus]|uniref:Uncharacterized protein n=1 Tax=Acorus gramineus TaxID=55184 RepID=A0AAV9A8J3_ACOGR|nr:hypothetical protein QJS04_geneDACA013328 [Acorus gramineus]
MTSQPFSYFSSYFSMISPTNNFLGSLYGLAGDGSSPKKHAVKWVNVCVPKDEGGLGLKCLKDWNAAGIGVRFWELASNYSSL